MGLARRLGRVAACRDDCSRARRGAVLARIQPGIHLLPVRTMNRSWRNAWIVALLMVGVLAIAYESFLRTRHYIPTVQDDADLWSIQYDRIKRDPHGVALLGASRIQYAVDP